MKDWDPTFDPMAALYQLNSNQKILNENQQAQQSTLQQLVQQLKSQQGQIDHLRQGLECANRANELLLEQLMTEMSRKLGDFDGQALSNTKTN